MSIPTKQQVTKIINNLWPKIGEEDRKNVRNIILQWEKIKGEK